MKLSVLALDFDGTIARDGRVGSETREALAEVRERGIAVVLATGRILEHPDPQLVCESPDREPRP